MKYSARKKLGILTVQTHTHNFIHLLTRQHNYTQKKMKQ